MESVYQMLAEVGYTHPIHPPVTHLTLGMVIGAMLFGWAALFSHSSRLAATARHCAVLALLAAIPTMFLGYMDWRHFYGGIWLFPIKMKIILATLLVILLVITVVLRSRVDTVSASAVAVYSLCFLTAVGIGYYGGELVYSTQRSSGASTARAENTVLAPQGAATTYADIAAIFQQHCVRCHSGSEAPDGLRLDSYAHILSGGKDGPVVIPGQPTQSELLLRIQGATQPRMPFGGAPLPGDDIAAIESWIAQGALE